MSDTVGHISLPVSCGQLPMLLCYKLFLFIGCVKLWTRRKTQRNYWYLPVALVLVKRAAGGLVHVVTDNASRCNCFVVALRCTVNNHHPVELTLRESFTMGPPLRTA